MEGISILVRDCLGKGLWVGCRSAVSPSPTAGILAKAVVMCNRLAAKEERGALARKCGVDEIEGYSLQNTTLY